MSKISNLMSPLKIESWSAKEVLNFTHEREISILLHVIDITLKFMVPLQVKLEHSHTEQATLNRQSRGGRAAALSSSSIPRLLASNYVNILYTSHMLKSERRASSLRFCSSCPSISAMSQRACPKSLAPLNKAAAC